MKFALKKLSLGAVACLTGVSAASQYILPAFAAPSTAGITGVTYKDPHGSGRVYTEFFSQLTGDVANAHFAKTTTDLSKTIAWLDWNDPSATITGITAATTNANKSLGTINKGATWEKEIIPGYKIKVEVTDLKPFEKSEVYKERVAGTSMEKTAEDAPDYNYRYEPNTPFEAATTSEAKTFGNASVEIFKQDVANRYIYLHYDQFEEYGSGSYNRLGGDQVFSSLGVTLSVTATINGNEGQPVDIIMADGEQLTEHEFVTYVTNGDNWRLFTEANGDEKTLESYIDANGKYQIPLHRRWFPLNITNLQGYSSRGAFDGDNYIGYLNSAPNAGLGTKVFGPYGTYKLPLTFGKDDSYGVNTIPFVESTNTTEVSFYSKGNGAQNTIIGFVVTDKGDAPSTYGLAQHNILTQSTQPDYGMIQQPQLGRVKADYDKPEENAFVGQGLEAVDTSADKNPWLYDDEISLLPNKDENGNPAGDEGEAQLTAEANGLYTFYSTSTKTNKLNIKASANGSNVAYARGWIDADNNGKFDADEASDIVEVPAGTDLQDITLTFNRTSDAKSDLTKMCARVRISNKRSDVENATGLAGSGEVEDFRVAVIESPYGEYKETTGKQGVVQTATVTAKARGLVATDATTEPSVINTIDAAAPAYIVNPVTGENAGTSLTVEGEGTYTIVPTAAGADITFTPQPSFTGTAKGIIIRHTDLNGTTTGWENPTDDYNINTITGTMDSAYIPTVTPTVPTAEPSKTIGQQGQKQTSNVLVDTEDDEKTTLNFFKGDETAALDPATLTLLDANGNPVDKVEVEGQGTYAVENGNVTFTPEADFVGTADPVTVQMKDANGTPAITTYTPTVIVAFDVTVKYEDESGKTIKPDVKVLDDADPETAYDITPNKDAKITTEDGVYYLSAVKEGSDPETGTLKDKDVVVTLVYQQAGNVVIKYQTNEGEKLLDDTALKTDEKPGTAYDTYVVRPATINKDGKTYQLQTHTGAETGEVVAGETIVVTYIYTEVVPTYGSIVVKYEDEDGNPVAPEIIGTTEKVGTEYKTNPVTVDGYTLIKTPDNANGTITEGVTTITYVYKKDPVKTGKLIVKHVDRSGKNIVDPSDSGDLNVGTKYTTNPLNSKSYKLVETPENASGEIVEGTTTVTYVYDKAYGSLVVKHVDEDGNELTETQTRNEILVGTKYSTQAGNFSGYTLKTTPDNANGEIIEGETVVTYVYTKDAVKTGNLIVKYQLEDGTDIVDPSVNRDLTVGTEYETKKGNFSGYTFVNVKGNETGKIVEGDTEVIYVYTKDAVETGSLLVKYVDEDGNDIVAPTSKTDLTVGSEYTTEAGKFDGYTLKTTPDNANGTITNGLTTVIYVYTKDAAPATGNLIVKHVDEDGKDIVAPSEKNDLTVGTNYKTQAGNFDGYTLKTTPENANGKIVKGTTTVTYVYKKAPDVNVPVAKGNLIVKYIDTEDNELVAPIVNNNLTVGTNYKTEKGNFAGYTYVETRGNETGKIVEGTTEVVYVYKKDAAPATGNLIVKYQTEDGADIVDPSVKNDLTVGTDYETKAGNFSGYTLVRVDGNETGKIVEGDTEVIYVYKKDAAPATGNLIVKHVDTDGNDIVAPTEKNDLTVGTNYETQKGNFSGYTFVEVQGNAAGKIVEGTTTVTYVYEKAPDVNVPVAKGNLVVKYVDREGNELVAPIVNNNLTVGTNYKTEAGSFSGYTLVETPANASGKIVEGTTTVVYIYDKNPAPATGNLVVKYIDENGNNIVDPITNNDLTVGTNYQTEKGNFSGYTFVEVRGNETGKIVEGTTEVVYVYKKNPVVTGNLIVKYQTEDGTDIVDPTVKNDLTVGSTYTTQVGNFDGYTLKTIPANANGTIVEGTTEVIYIYTKNPDTVKPEPVKTGNLVVKYVDESGNNIVEPSVSGQLAVGTKYETSAASFSGYYLLKTADNANGEIVEGTTTVVYVYAKLGSYIPVVPGKEIPKVPYDDTPEDPSNNDPLPYVPGYTPKDPETNEPLKPVDPEDPTKGYIPPEITDPNDPRIDTPVPYEKDPVKKGNLVVQYQDEEGNNLVDPTVENDLTVGTKYQTEAGKFSGYTLKTTPDNANGEIVEGTTTVTYIYTKNPVLKGNLVVKYVDEEGNDIVDPITNNDLTVGTNYRTQAGNFSGYTLKTTPENANGKIVEGTTTVVYVYTKNPAPATGNLVVKYVDEDGNNIVDPTTKNDLTVGTEYKTEAGSFSGYTLVETPSNANGKIVEGTTEVIYVYKKNPAAATGNLVVKHVDQNGNDIVDPVTKTELTVGSKYETQAGNFSGYLLKVTPDNANGSIVEGTTEVVYVYTKLGSYVPEVPGVEVPKVPYDNTPEDPTNNDPLPYVPGYTPKDPETNEPLKPVDPEDPTKGYIPPEIKDPEDPSVDTPVPYEKDPVKEGNLVVKYVDELGNNIVDPTVTDKMAVGTKYETSAGTFSGYILVSTPENATGKIVEGTTEVIYVYAKLGSYVPQVPGVEVPKVPYDDTPEDPTNNDPLPYVPGYTPKDPETNEPLKPVDPEDPTKGYIPPEITDPNDPTKDTPVPYEKDPVKTGNLIVKYVDEQGNDIVDPIVENELTVGTNYKTEAGTFAGYVLKQTPSNANGTIVEGTTTVTYVYAPYGSYVPQVPGQEVPKVPYDDTPEDPTNNPPLPYVPGYTPVDPKTEEPLQPVDPEDPTKGYIPPEITDPNDPSKDTPVPYVKDGDPAPEMGNVVVKYVDEDGNEIATKEIFPAQTVGSSYTTVAKEINGFELVGSQGPTSGTISKGETEVVYIYRANKTGDLVVKYVDLNGKDIVDPTVTTGIKTGTSYETKPAEIAGYVLKEVPANANGTITDGQTTVTYVYAPFGSYIPQIPGMEIPKVPYDNDPEDPTNNPPLPYVPGYTPVDPSTGEPLKPVDPEDPSKGYIPPAITNPNDPSVDTPVEYKKDPDPLPEAPATADVVTKFVDVNGKEIADPETQKGLTVGDPYTTTGKEIPGYVLVETPANANGTVDKDGNTVVYTYKPFGKYVPNLPGVPSVDYDNDPEDPSNNEPIPYVPGYTPKGPDGNPLKPVDPEDPSKGYIPPNIINPDDPTVDTPITYEKDPEPVKTFWVDEEGNNLKDPKEGEHPDNDGESDVPGYTLVKTGKDENGNIINTYKKTAEPAKEEETTPEPEKKKPAPVTPVNTTPKKSATKIQGVNTSTATGKTAAASAGLLSLVTALVLKRRRRNK
jgi:CshA-type fibril repeat protein/surface repeat SSSPR-51 protein